MPNPKIQYLPWKTLSINFLIKDSPTAVVILDTDMNIISHSKIWLEQFAPNKADKIIGELLLYYFTRRRLKQLRENI